MNKSFFRVVVAVVLLWGCGGEREDQQEIMEGDIASQQDPLIQRTLDAIDHGLNRGDQIMTTKVNEVLLSHNVNFLYLGMANLTSSAAEAPSTSASGSCPYLEPAAKGEQEDENCRFLALEAQERAQLAIDALNPNQEISSDFSKGDGNLAHYRTWFVNGTNNAVAVSAILLTGALRANRACDTHRAPTEQAYDRGIEVGRELYASVMNERLKMLGVDFSYPDGETTSQSLRYCYNNLRAPTIKDAEAQVAATLQTRPLCNFDSIEQQGDADRYRQAERRYQDGIIQGIADEDALAQKHLKTGGVCITTPLVLDLAGDGFHLGGGVRFDLLGNGEQVETSWIRGDDALLVRDRNGDGRIGDITELFGSRGAAASFANGFDHLASLDENGDGVIDDADAAFSELRVWQDSSGDGISAPEELSSLPAAGVAAIELRYDEGDTVDSRGNQFRQISRFRRTADAASVLGTAGRIADVWLSYW